MTTHNIESTSENWDERRLGADEAFVEVAEDTDQTSIDEILGLKLISIRLEQSLIDDFKAISIINNMGYQTLMRQVLKRFAESEKKLIAMNMEARRKEEAASIAAAAAAAAAAKVPHKSHSKQPGQKAKKAA